MREQLTYPGSASGIARAKVKKRDETRRRVGVGTDDVKARRYIIYSIIKVNYREVRGFGM